MAPVVVDLVSSSPSPARQSSQRDSPHPNAAQDLTLSGGAHTAQPSTSRQGHIETVLTSSYSSLLSNDPGLAVIARELPLEAEHFPKRRRLSPSGADRQAKRAAHPDSGSSPEVGVSKLATQEFSSGQKREPYVRKLSDDSDPFSSSPLPSPTAIVNYAARPIIDLASRMQDHVAVSRDRGTRKSSSDVFLSSFEPDGERQGVDIGRASHPSPDPFGSSPLGRPKATKLRTETGPAIDSSDPFASSPPLKVAKQPAGASSEAQPGPSRKLRYYDPISSSAPEHLTANGDSASAQVTKSIITIDDSDPEAEDDSDDELPDLQNIKPIIPRHAAREPMRRALSDTYATNRQVLSRKPVNPKISAEERVRAREARQRAQEVEKEAKKQEREQQKRIRALEKEKAAALVEVNKLRTDKKVSTREMIVDLPIGLDETLKTQVETILEELDVQHTAWQSPLPNVVKLRRKVDSRFDDDLGHWVPCPLQIMEENQILIIITAEELAKLAQEGLDDYVEKITTQMPTMRQLYILEGVTPWMRKKRNARNRQFASGVRAQNSSNATAASTQPRRRGNAAPVPEPISDDTIEDAMLQLQVNHGALIHHTNVPLETAQWIGHFTQHLSTAPYRRQRERTTTTAGFCMESGQVRTGDDAPDTYVRMLQEVARVTQPVAYGVAAEFGTVTKLVEGLEQGGQGRLEAVRKCANRDGAFSDRTLGKAVSKRLWQVFLGQDATSTDI